METPDEKLLLTAAWIFANHGRSDRACTLLDWVVAANPDCVEAVSALALLKLDAGNPERALELVRHSEFPARFARVGALLEARALAELGRTEEAGARWNRYEAGRRTGRMNSKREMVK